MSAIDPRSGQAPVAVTCYRHPDRPTGVRCVRCDRPICPDCMTAASVGFQCPECVRAGRASVRGPRRTTAARVGIGRVGVVTSGLVAANVLAYVVTVIAARSVNGNDGSTLFHRFSLVPVLVQQGDYWRVLTSAFLHFGLIHLVLNMVALVVLGADVERFLGRVRFLALYLVAALAGGVAVTLFNAPFTQTVGASGGIFGLLGAAVVILRQRGADLRPLGTVILLNVAISFLPGISLIGHLGGILGGALAAAVLVYAPGRRPALQAAGMTVLTVALFGLVLLA